MGAKMIAPASANQAPHVVTPGLLQRISTLTLTQFDPDTIKTSDIGMPPNTSYSAPIDLQAPFDTQHLAAIVRVELAREP